MSRVVEWTGVAPVGASQIGGGKEGFSGSCSAQVPPPCGHSLRAVCFLGMVSFQFASFGILEFLL